MDLGVHVHYSNIAYDRWRKHLITSLIYCGNYLIVTSKNNKQQGFHVHILSNFADQYSLAYYQKL